MLNKKRKLSQRNYSITNFYATKYHHILPKAVQSKQEPVINSAREIMEIVFIT